MVEEKRKHRISKIVVVIWLSRDMLIYSAVYCCTASWIEERSARVPWALWSWLAGPEWSSPCDWACAQCERDTRSGWRGSPSSSSAGHVHVRMSRSDRWVDARAPPSMSQVCHYKCINKSTHMNKQAQRQQIAAVFCCCCMSLTWCEDIARQTTDACRLHC